MTEMGTSMIKLDQSMGLQQKLAPQLIQSLNLLQLSNLELEQVVRQELEINPLLEEHISLELQQERPEENPSEGEEREEELDFEFTEKDWGRYLAEGFDMAHTLREGSNREDREEMEKVPAVQISLMEHLLNQLKLSDLSEQDQKIGEYIIGNIDDDGYLRTSVEEIAKALGTRPEDVERVLKTIQTFEPAGVGARDLQETLTIQLSEKGLEETLAMKIVQSHLEDLKRHRYSRIAKSLGVSENEIRDAMKEISKLNPKPGLGSFGRAAEGIIPDVIVERVDNDYVTILNEGTIPTLRINPVYRSILSESSNASEETRNYVVEKLNSARRLIRAIQQRRSTLLKLANYIVKAQRDFFDNGVSRLKPMVLREAAEALGMHPSTISRASRGKYIQTPHGIFELKYFFESKVNSSSGEDLSQRSVMERIRQLVEAEDPRNPLTDPQIAGLLKKEGINIARRTVSKYRTALGISPAQYRKKL
ncbi:MAG TPA: RNA polymerase factor sigma-54 [Candidatus Latescibacteria bacterium]|nr:RNA polymerase factor sigma-54 [Candidatus Latescibacterota bacterium]